MVAEIVASLTGCLVALCGYGVWENGAVKLHRLEVKDARLPVDFDGVRIAHVSDLHNAKFGVGQKKLASLLAEAQADAVFITGDLIDRRRRGMKNALDLIEIAVRSSPVYYVPGNHEALSGEYPLLREKLRSLGVRVLEDDTQTWRRGTCTVTVAGVGDPRGSVENENAAIARCMREKLKRVCGEGYTLLLSHRPERLSDYAKAGVGIAFCGHAHGGQFGTPWGGLIAPNQGLFPRYSGGVYQEGETQMVLSRGLGNSSIPIRLWNRPEILVVTLRRST